MCIHESKRCPRCTIAFECKVGSIILCQCSGVTLSEQERIFISEKYEDCLCAACMEALKEEYGAELFLQ